MSAVVFRSIFCLSLKETWLLIKQHLPQQGITSLASWSQTPKYPLVFPWNWICSSPLSLSAGPQKLAFIALFIIPPCLEWAFGVIYFKMMVLLQHKMSSDFYLTVPSWYFLKKSVFLALLLYAISNKDISPLKGIMQFILETFFFLYLKPDNILKIEYFKVGMIPYGIILSLFHSHPESVFIRFFAKLVKCTMLIFLQIMPIAFTKQV